MEGAPEGGLAGEGVWGRVSHQASRGAEAREPSALASGSLAGSQLDD